MGRWCLQPLPQQLMLRSSSNSSRVSSSRLHWGCVMCPPLHVGQGSSQKRQQPRLQQQLHSSNTSNISWT
jgi:hypothetical protein